MLVKWFTGAQQAHSEKQVAAFPYMSLSGTSVRNIGDRCLEQFLTDVASELRTKNRNCANISQ